MHVHIRRLRGPGGQIQGKHRLWDGDPPRRDAAEALGRLKDPRAIAALASVLEADDKVLRAEAIDALANIQHERAIKPLLRLLGDTSHVAGRRIQDRVGEAVRRLGEAELVDAVLAALVGDISKIKAAVGIYRSQVIEAFVVALEGTAGFHAAKALGELQALEALPEMRAVLRRVGERGRKGQALRAAIQELEARAALPRPADGGEVVADTLPRAAGEPGPETDTLPRSADESE